MTLRVNEVFYSIQGESSFAGLPCVFVRLTGCNLRCAYCDTTYAYESGHDHTIDQLLERIRFYDCHLVEITGGEPLLQSQTPELVSRLLSNDHEVLVETNGSFDINLVDSSSVRIMDLKCPSSGEQSKNNFGNIEKLTDHDEVKFVIGTREDYEFARAIVNTKLDGRKILFSTIFGALQPRILAEWIISDRINVRMQLQLHKYIWHPNQRGV